MKDYLDSCKENGCAAINFSATKILEIQNPSELFLARGYPEARQSYGWTVNDVFPARRCSSALAGLVAWIVLITLFAFVVPPGSDYMSAARRKHAHLSHISSPKIILIGGSNLAFGLDSAKLSQAFHRPVANMGLRAALGLTYTLNEVRENIQRGDIVVVSAEPKMFTEHLSDNGEILLESVVAFPQGLKFIDFRQFLNSSTDWPDCIREICVHKRNIYTLKLNAWLASGFKKWPEDRIYSANSFDSNGDHVAHLDTPSQSPIFVENYNGKHVRSDTVSELADFTRFAISSGARVVAVMPPYPSECYAAQKQIFSEEYDALSTINGIDLISSKERYVLDKQLFYDTVFHLNRRGRDIRTERLIQDLKLWMAHAAVREWWRRFGFGYSPI